jgi:hypothetical protein
MIVQFDEDYEGKKAGQRADMTNHLAIMLVKRGICSIPGEPVKKLKPPTEPVKSKPKKK